MTRVLIVNDDMVLGCAIEIRLLACGFDSFIRTSTRQEAIKAGQLVPGLVVVSDTIADGSQLETARAIAVTCGAPILLVTGGRSEPQDSPPAGDRIEGPFHITELDTRLEAACATLRDGPRPLGHPTE